MFGRLCFALFVFPALIIAAAASILSVGFIILTIIAAIVQWIIKGSSPIWQWLARKESSLHQRSIITETFMFVMDCFTKMCGLLTDVT